MKGWRPEGWVNPFLTPRIIDNRYVDKSYHSAFEAGADAMLEALRTDSKLLFRRDRHYTDKGVEIGTLVFIPDDKEVS
jgi:hypothetical protein